MEPIPSHGSAAVLITSGAHREGGFTVVTRQKKIGTPRIGRWRAEGLGAHIIFQDLTPAFTIPPDGPHFIYRMLVLHCIAARSVAEIHARFLPADPPPIWLLQSAFDLTHRPAAVADKEAACHSEQHLQLRGNLGRMERTIRQAGGCRERNRWWKEIMLQSHMEFTRRPAAFAGRINHLQTNSMRQPPLAYASAHRPAAVADRIRTLAPPQFISPTVATRANPQLHPLPPWDELCATADDWLCISDVKAEGAFSQWWKEFGLLGWPVRQEAVGEVFPVMEGISISAATLADSIYTSNHCSCRWLVPDLCTTNATAAICFQPLTSTCRMCRWHSRIDPLQLEMESVGIGVVEGSCTCGQILPDLPPVPSDTRDIICPNCSGGRDLRISHNHCGLNPHVEPLQLRMACTKPTATIRFRPLASTFRMCRWDSHIDLPQLEMESAGIAVVEGIGPSAAIFADQIHASNHSSCRWIAPDLLPIYATAAMCFRPLASTCRMCRWHSHINPPQLEMELAGIAVVEGIGPSAAIFADRIHASNHSSCRWIAPDLPPILCDSRHVLPTPRINLPHVQMAFAHRPATVGDGIGWNCSSGKGSARQL
ncbi:hypothetical protein FB451DRAFT_1168976 [Mycena latifolia]|nr:hypothetical protein FB451DRAFT_1168976 [Mycena latifolia]